MSKMPLCQPPIQVYQGLYPGVWDYASSSCFLHSRFYDVFSFIFWLIKILPRIQHTFYSNWERPVILHVSSRRFLFSPICIFLAKVCILFSLVIFQLTSHPLQPPNMFNFLAKSHIYWWVSAQINISIQPKYLASIGMKSIVHSAKQRVQTCLQKQFCWSHPIFFTSAWEREGTKGEKSAANILMVYLPRPSLPLN
jgi:hypothetical protein